MNQIYNLRARGSEAATEAQHHPQLHSKLEASLCGMRACVSVHTHSVLMLGLLGVS